jgi:KDO2-lipid IV(A) lauroyltransferase
VAQVKARLFAVGGRVSAQLPPTVRYGLARAAGTAGYAVAPKMRRQALLNYAGVLHLPPGSAAVRRVAREAVVGYTKLLADFLMLSTLDREQVAGMVDWRGWENIQQALGQGRGAIVVTPHFGNWDVAAAAAAARGLQVTAVTDHYGDENLNARVIAARERAGLRVVPLSVTAGKAALAALRRNEIVALVCDLAKEGGRNLRVSVCGQQVMVPAGPAVLALRSGAPVVPILCRRQPDNRYLLQVQPQIDFAPSGARDADALALTQRIMDRFEPELLLRPEQWYLFSPMWLGGSAGQAAPLGAGSGSSEGVRAAR